MKTTLEIPETLFRKAKALASSEGRSLKDFFTEAVQHQVNRKAGMAQEAKPWEKGFGALRGLHRENQKIQQLISQEFEKIDEDEWS